MFSPMCWLTVVRSGLGGDEAEAHTDLPNNPTPNLRFWLFRFKLNNKKTLRK